MLASLSQRQELARPTKVAAARRRAIIVMTTITPFLAGGG